MMRLLTLFCAACWALPFWGHPAGGGGAPCDSSVVVDVTYTPLGGGLVQLMFSVDTNEFLPTTILWQLDEAATSYLGQASVLHDFGGPGNYIACLTIEGLIPGDGPCTYQACVAISIPLPTVFGLPCSSSWNDFVGTFSIGQFTFELVTPLLNPVLDVFWDFGDGTIGSGTPISHGFNGPGPFEVCMTTQELDPNTQDTCSSVTCHWVYFGPDTLPCTDLVQASFETAQQGASVALFNTSLVTGLDQALHWELGDGQTSSLPQLAHTYLTSGPFEVCLTVTAWGALAADTCTSTSCQWVQGAVLASISEAGGGSSFNIWPNPVRDRFTITWTAENERANVVLCDALGRTLTRWSSVASGLTMDVSDLVPGSYFLTGTLSNTSRTFRVIVAR
ncbi:MAG: PKD domain-containing protein [Flavobacteriales bacterium]|nr:PKD domain-containing protein [Flavobacteriales bacterium]